LNAAARILSISATEYLCSLMPVSHSSASIRGKCGR
jgi:hypothetical protein